MTGGLRPIGGALGRVLDRSAPRTRLAELVMVWGPTVGEAIATRAEPVSEREGTVRVACESSVWAQELDLMAPDLCRRLNEALSEPWLAALRFTAVAPGEAPPGGR